MGHTGNGKRLAACLLAAVLTAGALTGCGGTGGGDTGSTGMSVESGDNGAVQGEEKEQGTAMGRYVEREISWNGSTLSDWNSRLFEMEDGSILLIENSGLVLRSWDKGGSWVREELPWFTRITQEEGYVLCMAMHTDGTAAVIWTDSLEEMEMKLLIVKPDSTEIPVEIPIGPEDMWLDSVYISDDGRIFVGTLSSTLYEVKEDGSNEKFLTVAEGRPELVRFSGNLMVLDGHGYVAPLFYDMEEQAYIEDEVLAEFVRENFNDRDGYPGKFYDMFLLPGEDDVIYVAGRTGIYRHVIGGTAMEQVLDGELSILGNPAYSIMDMLVVGDDEFLVLFMGGKAARFVYDPDVPTRPADKLKVYSLEDQSMVRQAISLYQKRNPAVYVEYEVGLEAQAATRDDAIKNLNTRIMAGDGPDVLILDDMPVDSYIEKGILMDVGPVLESVGGDYAVFPNVADTFRRDGQVYAIPCEIQLHYVLGRSADLEKMTDMVSMAGVMENMRMENPGKNLIRIPSYQGIMRMFSMTSAPIWKTQEGAVDREAVSDFLMQTKQIYDMELEGLSEEKLKEWEYYGDEPEVSYVYRLGSPIFFVAGYQQFMVGTLEDINRYDYAASVMTTEGFADCEIRPLQGQCGSVFWARTLAGINASSERTEMAQDFLKVMLEKEVQMNALEGLPVSRQAILDKYADYRRIYGGNDYVSGSSGLYMEEGEEVSMLIRVPNEDQVEYLLDWIDGVDTAYVEDKVFESVVYEEGAAYGRGDKSLTEAVDSIEKRLGIYLAE